MSSEEVVQRGSDYYIRELKKELLPQHKGDYVVINAQTFDYEVSDSELTATTRMLERDPNSRGLLYMTRVGYKLTYRMVPHYVEEDE